MLAHVLALAVFALSTRVRADAPVEPTADGLDALEAELAAVSDALLDARFPRADPRHAEPAHSIDVLDEVLAQAYADSSQGARERAVERLIDAVEGPRFRDFAALPSFAAAQLMLASLLIEERALGRAEQLIVKLIARGPAARTFGPAFQRGVDIALLRGDLWASADRLEAMLPESAPRDASDSLHYLRGLAAHDDGLFAQARTQLSAVTRASRFHPSARYLLGVIASAEGEHDQALSHFREVCPGCDDARARQRGYYASARLFALDDLVRLGLGRVAHEQRREEVAFGHYFRVPNDSPRVADALFEAAWASYARGQHALARDGLDQLEARFPNAPHIAEARVLRGYIAVAQRRFDEATQVLTEVEQTLTAQLADLPALPLPEAPRRERILAMERALRDARRASPRADAKLEMRVDALTRALAQARERAEHDARAALSLQLQAQRRRARIAHVDAIMGAMRALEDEIASLSAGRFPAEAPATRAQTGLLRDDEEYWPFEGEAWDDERAELKR